MPKHSLARCPPLAMLTLTAPGRPRIAGLDECPHRAREAWVGDMLGWGQTAGKQGVPQGQTAETEATDSKHVVLLSTTNNCCTHLQMRRLRHRRYLPKFSQ